MSRHAALRQEIDTEALVCETVQSVVGESVRLAWDYARSQTVSPIALGEVLEDLANDLLRVSDEIAAQARVR